MGNNHWNENKGITVDYYENYLGGLKAYYLGNPDCLAYEQMVKIEHEIMSMEGMIRRIRFVSAKRFRAELGFVKR